MNHKIRCSPIVLAGLLLCASSTMAQEVESDTHTLSCVGLPDEVNYFTQKLESKSAVHCYTFKALRGQAVMLSTPGPDAQSFWQVDYLEGGQWKQKQSINVLKISDLSPGADVVVKVSHKPESEYQSRDYSLGFGSYPVLKEANLTAPAIRNRVPVSDSGWVAGLQTHGELTVESKFTDSTGHPLKGAVATLRIFLTLGSQKPELEKTFRSDEKGMATQAFKLDKCYGGERTAERNDAQGKGYWVSDYNVGQWFVFDGLIGRESEVHEAKKTAGFAHICRQVLKRGRTDRW